MIELMDKDTRAPIGSITPDEHAILMQALEPQRPHAPDFWIDRALVAAIETRHPEAAALVALLRNAIGGREGVEIVCGSAF